MHAIARLILVALAILIPFTSASAQAHQTDPLVRTLCGTVDSIRVHTERDKAGYTYGTFTVVKFNDVRGWVWFDEITDIPVVSGKSYTFVVNKIQRETTFFSETEGKVTMHNEMVYTLKRVAAASNCNPPAR